jgi:hypothetical protein
MVLRRILGPSLETGAVFDAALSGNWAIAIGCLRAVQEKCDEKDRGVRLGKSHARDGRGIPPFSQSARKRMGNRQKWNGRTPQKEKAHPNPSAPW